METPQTYRRFDIHVDGIRSTYLSWEYNGVSHTASVENEYVGGRGLWGQTVSDIGGRGSYMPPGYKGVMPENIASTGNVLSDWYTANSQWIKYSVTTTFSQNSLIGSAATTTVNSIKATSKGASTISMISKISTRVGIAGVVADGVLNGIDVSNGKMSMGEFGVRTACDIGILFLSVSCPVAGLVIGTVNAFGGFDRFYSIF